MAGVEPTKEEFCTYAGKLAETQTLAQLSAEERAVLDQMCSTIETQYGSIPQITQLKEAIKKIKWANFWLTWYSIIFSRV